jgi:chromosome segregation ATPase
MKQFFLLCFATVISLMIFLYYCYYYFHFRDCSADLYRARASLDDVTEQLDAGRRENKNLSLEIKDLLEQIGDGGRSLHEVEKQCRRLEEEKEELANALDEAEAALEQVL